MGIVNVTPDSFSDGGQFSSVDAAVLHGLKLVEDGADILDIGGESTRPGAQFVAADEELARVVPVIEKLASVTDRPISIDTRKPMVARAAIKAGAAIWNDVSALTFSDKSLPLAAELGCDIILMHAQGTPQTMQDQPHYDDVVSEVAIYLRARLEACLVAGIARDRVMVDPGIGFGKTLEHNLALMRHLDRLVAIAPVLLGASRKRFIAALDQSDGAQNAHGRVAGSVAAALSGIEQGVSVLRVHDVAATVQAIKTWDAIKK